MSIARDPRTALFALLLALATIAAYLLSAGPLDKATPVNAAAPAPAWGPIAVSGPTHLAPGSEGKIAVYIQNVGGEASAGTITITDNLPAGITTSKTPTGTGWSCSPAGAGQSAVSCTSTEAVGPGLATKPVLISVNVDPAAKTAQNTVTASGGGATGPPATYEAPVTVDSTPAKPGAMAFTAGAFDDDGSLNTQAASHPYAANTAIFVNTVLAANGDVVPAGDPKTIAVDLPPGFIGNPVATPRCPEGLVDDECEIETQVGVAQPVINSFGAAAEITSVHSVAAPIGYPAKFTFSVANVFQVNAIATLRSDEDFGATVTSPNTAQASPVYGTFFSFWGEPADASHDPQRCVLIFPPKGCGESEADDTAFLTQASDCALQAEVPPLVGLSFDTWLTIDQFERRQFAVPAVKGCDQLELPATFAFQPKTQAAATPSAFSIDLTLDQERLEDPDQLAPPPLKRTEVFFPAGVSLNPSAADGLETCSLAQIGYKGNGFAAPNRIRFDKTANRCPDASKIATVEVDTPLLDDPLPGALYLAAQNENPFGSLLAVYLVVEDPTVGIVVKLPGEMRADPLTGQLSAIFDDGPQTPFETVKILTKGGDRAPLATPDICGKATTNGRFTPWSAPESGLPTPTVDSFEVTSGPGGAPCANTRAQRPFAPAFSAGTATSAADAYSPLRFKITRKDGEAELKGIQLTLPGGLTGKLAGIATCADTAIAAGEAKTGKAEQAAPSCPATSRLGTVTSAAGIGGTPIHVGGRVYLAGPYKGAPLSVVTIIPAVAGPYDLGNVVTRAATYIDPASAQLSAVTDPIPDILQGIPLQVRSVEVNLDRPGFTLTPTSCEAMSIAAKLSGAGGATANATAPFKVAGCDSLAFKPKLRAKLHGGTARNSHPSLRAELIYPSAGGYANTRYAQVALPHSEFLDQSHIVTVCTRPQFAAKACPKGSIYGHAKAITPLLDEPLEGPVYLRSSDNKLPDLAVALRGPVSRPIEVVLAGRIDSIHGGIRTTFESAPDAPVKKFVLTMKGGKKGLLVNSRNLCTTKKKARMTVRLIAHNNKRADQFPVLGNECGKKGKRG